MLVIGIDPGYRQSAVVVWDGSVIKDSGILPNDAMLEDIAHWWDTLPDAVLVLEEMQLFKSSFGVGREVFDSVFWSGRFAQEWEPRRWERILRAKVRGHLGASKGGDATVRAALIDKFGPYKEQAIGKKKAPGPLYGLKADMWSALAIAVVWYELYASVPREVRPGVTPEF